MDRRTFALAAMTGVAAPVLLAATPAEAAGNSAANSAGGSAGRADGSKDRGGARLQREMSANLSAELDDAATARAVVPSVFDIGFNWDPPTTSPAKLDFIVAYSFGNRAPAGGGDPTKVLYEPGPVNEALADTVARVRAKRNVPVYAQWEIARFLTSKYRMTDVTSIEPVIAADGTITYLSTFGVAAQVLGHRKQQPGGVGTAGVVGFRDHVKRCVETTRLAGMPAAYAPAGFTMPGTYDTQSGQAWTRRRDLYLVHDMSAQWQMLEQTLLAGQTG
ncbi:hypothetical protein OG455_00885 [Kitasatospora sp. NBC_01287]|uniref:hypothetical protein n=1 Tax=Kitasatospora sp. NBC_01287 TaxID=2903573 RepID=UPI00225599FB|nr:hypothetical protein [Kitasatospora sp. NBC_01287]MCX4744080.1 hypothetical protein [Kitasatospora sp. NBC_01287]